MVGTGGHLFGMGEAGAAVGALLPRLQHAVGLAFVAHVEILLLAGVVPLDILHEAGAAGLHDRLEDEGLIHPDEIQGAVPPALGQVDDGGLGDDHLFHGVQGGAQVEMDLRVPAGEHVGQLGAKEHQVFILPVEMGLRLQAHGLLEDLEAHVQPRAGHIPVAPEIGLGGMAPIAPMGLLGDKFIKQLFVFFLHSVRSSLMLIFLIISLYTLLAFGTIGK